MGKNGRYLSEMGTWIPGEHWQAGDTYTFPPETRSRIRRGRTYTVHSVIWQRPGQTFVTFRELTKGQKMVTFNKCSHEMTLEEKEARERVFCE